MRNKSSANLTTQAQTFSQVSVEEGGREGGGEEGGEEGARCQAGRSHAHPTADLRSWGWSRKGEGVTEVSREGVMEVLREGAREGGAACWKMGGGSEGKWRWLLSERRWITLLDEL
jgi:hypothetical protein